MELTTNAQRAQLVRNGAAWGALEMVPTVCARDHSTILVWLNHLWEFYGCGRNRGVAQKTTLSGTIVPLVEGSRDRAQFYLNLPRETERKITREQPEIQIGALFEENIPRTAVGKH